MGDEDGFCVKYRGHLAVMGGFLIHIILGSLYLWGVINGYVSSYFYWKGHPVSTSTLNAVFPFIFQSGGIAVLFTEKVMGKIGVQPLCIICAIMMSGSVLISSFSPNAIMFSIFYGIIYGFFQGLVLYAPIYNGYLYFPHKKGMVTGIIAAGFGVGNLILSQISYALINPDNEEPIIIDHLKYKVYPKSVADNLPFALQILSAIYISVLLLGTYFVRPPLKENEDSLLISGPRLSVISSSLLRDEYKVDEMKKIDDDETPILQALKTPYPYVLLIQAWSITSVGMVISNNYKQYGLNFPALENDHFLTTLGSITSVFNAIGRPFWGTMMDFTKFRYLILINLSLQIGIVTTLQFSVQNKWFYSFWVLLVYLMYGGSYAMIVPACVKVYGAKSGKKIYGFVYQGFCLQSWTQFLIVRFSLDSIGYDNIFYIYAGIAGIGILATILFPLRSKSDKKTI